MDPVRGNESNDASACKVGRRYKPNAPCTPRVPRANQNIEPLPMLHNVQEQTWSSALPGEDFVQASETSLNLPGSPEALDAPCSRS